MGCDAAAATSLNDRRDVSARFGRDGEGTLSLWR